MKKFLRLACGLVAAAMSGGAMAQANPAAERFDCGERIARSKCGGDSNMARCIREQMNKLPVNEDWCAIARKDPNVPPPAPKAEAPAPAGAAGKGEARRGEAGPADALRRWQEHSAKVGAVEKKDGEREHQAAASAHQCLKLVAGANGVENTCDYAVEYVYCVVKPTSEAAQALDCESGKLGSWQAEAKGRSMMQSAGERTLWFACRYGPSLKQYDGVTVAGVKYEPGKGLTGRCIRWGAG